MYVMCTDYNNLVQTFTLFFINACMLDVFVIFTLIATAIKNIVLQIMPASVIRRSSIIIDISIRSRFTFLQDMLSYITFDGVYNHYYYYITPSNNIQRGKGTIIIISYL